MSEINHGPRRVSGEPLRRPRTGREVNGGVTTPNRTVSGLCGGSQRSQAWGEKDPKGSAARTRT
ncbi:hypothetical protein GS506_11420 [Rhodococcus hoagii]|nr:hypothetical protein [Prescottella equi]